MMALPAGYALPGLLTSCSTKDNLFEDLNFSGKVIVIGAGAAGLHAAYILHKNGVDVQVLEAYNRIGGRIRKLENFAGYPLELGAEAVHGRKSVFYDSIRISNFESYELKGKDVYNINEELVFGDAIASNPVYLETESLHQRIINYSGPDIPIATFLEAEGASEEAMQLLNAIIGNEYGTDNDSIGILGYQEAEKKWTAGEGDIILRTKGLSDVLEVQYSAIMSKIRLSTPVREIDYSGSKIIVTDHASQTYEADKLIVTVPLSILKEGAIAFTPAFSEEKIEAMDKLGMDHGMKIFMRFSQNFWGDDTGSVYPGGIIPEYTVPGWGRESQFNDNQIFFNNILVGFANGSAAAFLTEEGQNAVTIALRDLDEAFNGQASQYLTEYHIMDWSQETFIKGAYSYPKPEGAGAREALAAPIDEKVYFAGEATHTTGHFGTVHGAMETGYRAAYEVLKSIS